MTTCVTIPPRPHAAENPISHGPPILTIYYSLDSPIHGRKAEHPEVGEWCCRSDQEQPEQPGATRSTQEPEVLPNPTSSLSPGVEVFVLRARYRAALLTFTLMFPCLPRCITYWVRRTDWALGIRPNMLPTFWHWSSTRLGVRERCASPTCAHHSPGPEHHDIAQSRC
jgi:hypothetical protein